MEKIHTKVVTPRFDYTYCKRVLEEETSGLELLPILE
jgi:hypothetical protein